MSALVLLAAAYILVSYIASKRVTPIFMYHSILDDGGALSVSRDNFAKQMKFLNDNGYSVISLDKLVYYISNGKTYAPKTVAITFDDGLEDNFINAFPALSKYSMPATIFLISNYVGKKDGYLTPDQVLVMSKNGVDFGGHTENHAYLPGIADKNILMREINGCKKPIEEYSHKEVKYFCYPLGGFNGEIKDIVKNAGYKAAFTTNRGINSLNNDLYELKRIKITNSDMNKPFHFRAKLSGFYNLFRSHKNGD